MKRIANFIKNNKVLFTFFILSTIYFIIQHYFYLSWDLSVYISNAKYWFSDGTYFESIRPPLASILIGILSFFKFYEFGKYAFIVLSSIFYFVMCIKLADRLKINKTLFYALCLNSYVLTWGMSVGTEILTLSLIGLFVLLLLKKRDGGLLLGLSSIARYQMAPLSALILLYKKPIKIIRNIFYFSIPLAIWLIYNYFSTGNPFTAIADSYAQNVLARLPIAEPFDLTHLLMAGNIMFGFFAYYIYRITTEVNFRKNALKEWEINLIMAFIAAFTIYTYATTPSKEVRYLFNLTLPLAYFSSKALSKFDAKKIGMVLGVLFIVGTHISFALTYPYASIPKAGFESNINEIEGLGIKNCSIRSDIWPLLSYYGYSANFNRIELTEKYIENGEYLVLFPKYGEYKYQEFNENIIIKQTSEYVVLGNQSMKCKEAKPVYHSFLQGYNESVFLKIGETADINPYNILFKKKCC